MLLDKPPDGFLNKCTDVLALDLETTRLYSDTADPLRDKILLVSLANREETIVVRPGPWMEQLWEVFKRDILVLIHNAGFDLPFLKVAGMSEYPDVYDTMIVERVLTAGTYARCGLSSLAWRHLAMSMDKTLQSSFSAWTTEFSDTQIAYAKHDADVLIPLREEQQKLVEEQSIQNIIDLENDLVPIIVDMELLGIDFDVKGWDALVANETAIAGQARSATLRALELPDYTFDLFSDTVGGVNLNSPVQMLKVLKNAGFRINNTREKTLDSYLRKHDDNRKSSILRHFIAYKKAMKRIGFNYPKHKHPIDGRIHTSYNQTGAVTGRLSSSKPNLQNVPNLSAYRSLFVASKGYLFAIADYSQQEMRTAAELSQDKNLIEVCMTDDIHLENAHRLFKDTTIEKSDDKRKLAKSAGFAMINGATPETVAKTAGIPLADAIIVVDYTKQQFSGVEDWAGRNQAHALEYGWVETLGGRRRWFRDIGPGDVKWMNEARNAPIQGSAADMIKLAMIKIARALKEAGLDADLILTVHDEVVTRIAKDQVEQGEKIIRREMMSAGEQFVKCVPCPVDINIAPYWGK